jgi:dTDP-glucose 4,6-dehydratase
MVLELMGKPDDWFEHVDDRPGHDLRYAIDATKLRLETDWMPRYGDVRAGLEATIEWYATHRDWWEAAKVESERTYARLGR